MKHYSERDLRNDVKQYIARTEVSQAEVARRIGISRSHLNKFIHGEKSAAGKIAAWLGYEAVTMFTFKGRE